MKKVTILLGLLFAICQTSNAQIKAGVKAGINYNTDSFKEVKDDVLAGTQGKAGFHAGLWFQAKLPVVGIFLRPEIVYTNVNTKVTYRPRNVETSYKLQKIDIPVLVGKRLFNVVNVFAGPSFQYLMDADFDLSQIDKDEIKKFTMGFQFGGGLEFGKIGIDLRWERSLSTSEMRFVDNNINENIEFDNRNNQVILSISYKL